MWHTQAAFHFLELHEKAQLSLNTTPQHFLCEPWLWLGQPRLLFFPYLQGNSPLWYLIQCSLWRKTYLLPPVQWLKLGEFSPHLLQPLSLAFHTCWALTCSLDLLLCFLSLGLICVYVCVSVGGGACYRWNPGFLACILGKCSPTESLPWPHSKLKTLTTCASKSFTWFSSPIISSEFPTLLKNLPTFGVVLQQHDYFPEILTINHYLSYTFGHHSTQYLLLRMYNIYSASTDLPSARLPGSLHSSSQ